MMREIFDEVYKFADSLLLNYTAPNLEVVREALQFDVNNLDSLPDQDLSKYVVVLGQYLITVQSQTNQKKVDSILFSKALEHEINLRRSIIPKEEKITNDKQRRSWLIENDETIRDLYYKDLKAAAESAIIENMNKAIEAYLNALKKEKSSRNPYEA